jgi:hypothetical protein
LKLKFFDMSIEKIELIDFGVFDNNEVDLAQQPDEKSPAGYTLLANDLKVVHQTDQIEMRKGVTFGIKYKVHGQGNGEEIAYQRRIAHPDIKDPESGQVRTERVDIRGEKAGAETFDFYRLDEPHEMQAGTWTFQLLDGPTVLLEKSFELK